MENMVKNVRSPLFAGIEPTDMEGMLGCIGYHVRSYQKGEIIAFEEENINHVGVVLEGTVDMIKEDVWGNRTMLLRTYPEDIFGETFACGEDSLSVVTFVASRDCKVLFLSPFSPLQSLFCLFVDQSGKNRDENSESPLMAAYIEKSCHTPRLSLLHTSLLIQTINKNSRKPCFTIIRLF